MSQKGLKAKVEHCSEIISKLKKEIGKIVIGQQAIVDGLIRALLADGHVLIEGVPGIAKTLLIKTLGKVQVVNSKESNLLLICYQQIF
jgi:MoxR-like ATPase